MSRILVTWLAGLNISYQFLHLTFKIDLLNPFIVLQVIDNFLVKARDTLSVRPQSVEEVGEVNQMHTTLSKEKSEVEHLFVEADKKNKLLRSVAGHGMDELSSLKAGWDKFEVMMESHQLMVKDQVRQLHILYISVLYRN